MGSSTYSYDDYDARTRTRAATGKSAFVHHAAIRSGAVSAGVHEKMNPYQVTRECRDSEAHPVSVPIGILLDTTGSMQEVPVIIQKKLNRLMGCFLDDKASGKRYLGDGYPAICIGAVDDYDAIGPSGALQVGQFESGIEIDDNLGRLWLTGAGGGTYEEEYALGVYFYAWHTVHDHWEKRHRKGYLFLIGDEHAYATTHRGKVEKVIGDKLQGDLPVAEIIREAQKRYHVFFIIPGMSHHYNDPELERYWVKLLGQQNVIKLPDPEKICETIVAAVAICESHIGVADITADLGLNLPGLVLLSKSSGVVNALDGGLAPVPGKSGGHKRL